MADPNVIAYITTQRQQGVTDTAIRQALLDTGWDVDTVEVAFQALNAGPLGSLNDKGTTLLDFSGLLKNSWELLRNNLTPILALMAIPYVANVAVSLLAQSLTNTTTDPTAFTGTGVLGGLILFSFIAGIVVMLFQVWATLGILYIIKGDVQGDVMEALNLSFKKILPYWWTVFIGGVLVFLGTMALIVPGIIMVIWYIFSPYVVIEEGLSGFAALKQSREYVRDYWFGVAGRLLGVGIVTYLALLPITIVYGLLSFSVGEPVASLVGDIATYLAIPLPFIFNYLLYQNLRQIKPHSSIESSNQDSPPVEVAT